MTLSHRPRPFLRCLANTGLALSVFFMIIAALPVVAPAAVRFGVRYQKEILTNRVNALMVLPGKAVTFEVIDPDPKSNYVAQPTGGQIVPLGPTTQSGTDDGLLVEKLDKRGSAK